MLKIIARVRACWVFALPQPDFYWGIGMPQPPTKSNVPGPPPGCRHKCPKFTPLYVLLKSFCSVLSRKSTLQDHEKNWIFTIACALLNAQETQQAMGHSCLESAQKELKTAWSSRATF